MLILFENNWKQDFVVRGSAKDMGGSAACIIFQVVNEKIVRVSKQTFSSYNPETEEIHLIFWLFGLMSPVNLNGVNSFEN